jgi:hypothetical protein
MQAAPPGVFNGDDGLIGKAREQSDLPVGKWTDCLLIYADRPDQIICS